eukprot:IDg13189t1
MSPGRKGSDCSIPDESCARLGRSPRETRADGTARSLTAHEGRITPLIEWCRIETDSARSAREIVSADLRPCLIEDWLRTWDMIW